jgi:hypothetical protein
VSEIRILRRIFGPKRDEVTGEWSKLYSSPNVIKHIKSRRIRWAGHVERMGEECVQGFGGNVRRKRPLGRPRRKWEDGIRMYLR